MIGTLVFSQDYFASMLIAELLVVRVRSPIHRIMLIKNCHSNEEEVVVGGASQSMLSSRWRHAVACYLHH